MLTYFQNSFTALGWCAR